MSSQSPMISILWKRDCFSLHSVVRFRKEKPLLKILGKCFLLVSRFGGDARHSASLI